MPSRIISLAILVAVAILVAGSAFVAANQSKPANTQPPLEDLKILGLDNAQIEAQVKALGPKQALKDMITKSNAENTDCHQLAHQLGRIAYQIYKEKLFELVDSSCNSGAYHGAIESLFYEKGTQNLNKTISDLCNKMKTGHTKFECLHGSGHGVIAFLNYNLPYALDTCAKLDDSFSQQSCYGGVFMENIVASEGSGVAASGHTTKWVNEDPYFPCNAVKKEQPILYECYMMQTSRMFVLNKWDFNKVAYLCQSVEAPNDATCYRSFGRDVAGYTVMNTQRMIDLCKITISVAENFNNCIIGAINVVLDYWNVDIGTQAVDLCKNLGWVYKQSCYNVIIGRLPGLFNEKDKIKSQCELFENDFQNSCKSIV